MTALMRLFPDTLSPDFGKTHREILQVDLQFQKKRLLFIPAFMTFQDFFDDEARTAV